MESRNMDTQKRKKGEHIRRRSRIDLELSVKEKDALNEQLLKGMTYAKMKKFVADMGHNISVSVIQRYCTHYLKHYNHIKSTEEQARIIAQAAGKDCKLEEGITALIAARLFNVLNKNEIRIEEYPRLIAAIASLQNATTKRKHFEHMVRKADRAGNEIADIAKEQGLSDETIEIMKSKIFEIVKK